MNLMTSNKWNIQLIVKFLKSTLNIRNIVIVYVAQNGKRHPALSLQKFCIKNTTFSTSLGSSDLCFLVMTSLAFEKRRSDGTEVADTASNSRATAATPGNRTWFFAHQSSGQLFLSMVSASIYSRISCLRACCMSSRDVVGEHVSLIRSSLSYHLHASVCI